MKCTESEDEEPIKGKESQLQLSCFINQEVKYLATGLRLVWIRLKFNVLKKRACFVDKRSFSLRICPGVSLDMHLRQLVVCLFRFSHSKRDEYNTRHNDTWLVCLHGNEDQILFVPCFSLQRLQEEITKMSTTLERNALYIKSVSLSCNVWYKYSGLLEYKMHLPPETFLSTLQSKLSRLPAYLTVQMVRFFYKEKESVNAKVLKVCQNNHVWFTTGFSTIN